MTFNQARPLPLIVLLVDLPPRWAVDVADFLFFALLPFIGNRALRLTYFPVLHAFTKANDTPMDNYDTPAKRIRWFTVKFAFFYGVSGEMKWSVYYCMYILRKSAHVNIEMKLWLLSTSSYV